MSRILCGIQRFRNFLKKGGELGENPALVVPADSQGDKIIVLETLGEAKIRGRKRLEPPNTLGMKMKNGVF